MRVLTIDDEPSIRAAIRRALTFDGHEVVEADGGAAGLDALRPENHGIDVVLLDIAMPDIDGLEVCRRIRAVDEHLPIILLTAQGEISDRVTGLDTGADDYIVKPFDLDELLARVRAAGRRNTRDTSNGQSQGTLVWGDLTIDLDTRMCSRAGSHIALTRTEFDLLALFMRSPKRVLTRENIHEAVWGFDFGSDSTRHEVHISSLRRKLEAGGAPRIIQTVRGVGFALREES